MTELLLLCPDETLLAEVFYRQNAGGGDGGEDHRFCSVA